MSVGTVIYSLILEFFERQTGKSKNEPPRHRAKLEINTLNTVVDTLFMYITSPVCFGSREVTRHTSP